LALNFQHFTGAFLREERGPEHEIQQTLTSTIDFHRDEQFLAGAYFYHPERHRDALRRRPNVTQSGRSILQI
jgi:hypothetical protein